MLDSSKLKEFADDNFKFDENGRKFCKRVEITAGKGEIAYYSFSPSVFKRFTMQSSKNLSLLEKGFTF